MPEADPCAPGAGDPRRLIRVLALPTFGLSLAVSVLITYGPMLLHETTGSTTAIGLVIGGEGAFALLLPLFFGRLSDRTRPTRLGRRLPYAVAAAPVIAVSIALLPFAATYAAAAAAVGLFFVAYNVYIAPYGALYGDLVPATHYGRAQGSQALARGLGLGAALVGGGALLAVWTPLPFLIGALAVVAVTAVLVAALGMRSREQGRCPRPSTPLRALLRKHRGLRAFVVANSLWELSFTGLRTFIVLFIVEGLGRSTGTASAIIGVVAAAYVAAAVVSGRLADHLGIGRVLRWAAWLYGIGLCVGASLTTLTPFLVGLPLVAFLGAVLLTLPYGLLLRLTPAGSEGASAGLFGFSRGIGGILGPVLVGGAIDLFGPWFSGTAGYGVMWLAIGIPILLSLPFVAALEGEERRRTRPVLAGEAP